MLIDQCLQLIGSLVDALEVVPVMRAWIALGTESAWAMGTSVAWVRAGGKLQLFIGSPHLFRNTEMAKESITVTPKKRGRPATGQDPVLTVRLPLTLRSMVETWAKQQKDTPSRSEAIRRLIEAGLARKVKRQRG